MLVLRGVAPRGANGDRNLHLITGWRGLAVASAGGRLERRTQRGAVLAFPLRSRGAGEGVCGVCSAGYDREPKPPAA
jgi:hypothetical protein